MMTLVNIVVWNNNYEKFITQTIKCIVNQGCENIDFIE